MVFTNRIVRNLFCLGLFARACVCVSVDTTVEGGKNGSKETKFRSHGDYGQFKKYKYHMGTSELSS